MKFDYHVRHVVMKARSVAGRILRSFSSRNTFVILPLFDSIVRPILEYATPVWNPGLAKHTKAIESVQRSVTKRLCGLQKFSYVERIRAVGVSSLGARRDYIDLVEMFKIIHGHSMCGHVAVPTRNQYATRGHRYRLEQCKCTLNSYRFSFFVRVVKAWNCLPRKVVDSKSLAQFKVNLRRHMHI
jgi:ribonucleases P/MRP protein subunit RPP40